jgi:glycosyltransferase involved in cell wall biosynthesis
MGAFEPDSFARVLEDLDLVVLPSLWQENSPLVLLSAQATRRPVVVSDMRGLTELVEHGVNGEVFPAGDADALASILRRLATDRSHLLALASRARPPPSMAQAVDAMEAEYDMAQRRTVLP